jgi:hypothetical protein
MISRLALVLLCLVSFAVDVIPMLLYGFFVWLAVSPLIGLIFAGRAPDLCKATSAIVTLAILVTVKLKFDKNDDDSE